MKKKTVLLALTIASVCLSTGVIALTRANFDINSVTVATDGSYWYHYAQVTPTETKHGSKEFWANCSTHNFVLEDPGVGEDVREGVAFDTTKYFDELTSEDARYLPPLSERVDIKGYFQSLLSILSHDPYSFIPDTMRPDGVDKHSEDEFIDDWSDFVNVNDVVYGGFGEQWHMVIENIKESERFFKITSYGSEVITASTLLVNTFLDNYYDGTVDKTFSNDSRFISKLSFDGLTLVYNLKYISGINIPYFGEIIPQIDMSYDITGGVKSARIQLGDNAALKFITSENSYSFGLDYGISTVSRKAYFSLERDDETDALEGHIYEYVQYKDKDLVPACADFYIDEDYVTAVGNKASGLVGFNNYISELYRTDDGKLLGYEIQETKTVSKVEVTFNTLWFNLDNITGINSVKTADDKVYVNNSSSEFKTKNFGGFNTKTASRRYDIEWRKQYFFDEAAGEIQDYEVSIPMMFVQEEKLSEFASDVHGENSYLTVAINLSNTYLTKIQDDYDALVPVFIDGKDSMPSTSIVEYIGDAAIIG